MVVGWAMGEALGGLGAEGAPMRGTTATARTGGVAARTVAAVKRYRTGSTVVRPCRGHGRIRGGAVYRGDGPVRVGQVPAAALPGRAGHADLGAGRGRRRADRETGLGRLRRAAGHVAPGGARAGPHSRDGHP